MFNVNYLYPSCVDEEEEGMRPLIENCLPKVIHFKFTKETYYNEKLGVLDKTSYYKKFHDGLNYYCTRTFDNQYLYNECYKEKKDTYMIKYTSDLIDVYGDIITNYKDNIILRFELTVDDIINIFKKNNKIKDLKCVLINMELLLKYNTYILENNLFVYKIKDDVIARFATNTTLSNTSSLFDNKIQTFYLLFLSEDDEMMLKLIS